LPEDFFSVLDFFLLRLGVGSTSLGVSRSLLFLLVFLSSGASCSKKSRFFEQVLVSVFTGGVFGLQSIEAFRRFQADSYVGTAVSLTLTRELAPVLTAVPMSLIGLAPSYGVLLILLFIAGISIAMFHVPAPVMIAKMAGSKTGRGMSFFMTGGELARTVGPLTAVALVALMGLEGFWPVMVVGIAASGLLFFRFRNIDLNFHDSNAAVPLGQTFRNMRHVLLPLTMILLARGFMHASMTAFLPVFLRQQEGGIWLGGAGLALFEAAGVAGVLAAGSLSDHLGRRKMLLISLVGAPLALFVFLYCGGWLRTLALLACGFTLLSTTPVMLAMVQEQARESPAAANGIFMMTSFLARSSMVVLIGLTADHIGLHSAYLAAGLVGLIGIPFVLLLPGNRR